jgi:hypothetical protein
MILDGFNGGGFPRDVNFGPMKHRIGAMDAKACGDCEDKLGVDVVVMGYGCY